MAQHSRSAVRKRRRRQRRRDPAASSTGTRLGPSPEMPTLTTCTIFTVALTALRFSSIYLRRYNELLQYEKARVYPAYLLAYHRKIDGRIHKEVA